MALLNIFKSSFVNRLMAEVPSALARYSEDNAWVQVELVWSPEAEDPAVGRFVAFMRDAGKTVCIVEHSIHVVERLADTVFFMELGRITAQGTISELTSNPRLAEVYFGTA